MNPDIADIVAFRDHIRNGIRKGGDYKLSAQPYDLAAVLKRTH